MTFETILDQIQTQIQDIPEKSEQSILNSMNSVLFPLKDKGDIFHYYFRSKSEDGTAFITLFIQETMDSPVEAWDIEVLLG